jgi:DnaJ-class molecular chaperone
MKFVFDKVLKNSPTINEIISLILIVNRWVSNMNTNQKKMRCSACNSTDCENKPRVETCVHCYGTGKDINRNNAKTNYEINCIYCQGTGSMIKRSNLPCRICNGSGSISY